MEKVCSDIHDGLNEIRKSSIIWSLITSFGILRYKDTGNSISLMIPFIFSRLIYSRSLKPRFMYFTDLLENFHMWIISNQTICKTKDFVSLLITSANVNYMSPSFDRFFEVRGSHSMLIGNLCCIGFTLIILYYR